MLNVHAFVFNPFQENTYLVYDELGNCAIFDPGMSNADEEAELVAFIKDHNLKLNALYITHGHIDHVLGNRFIFDQYGLTPQMHEGEVPVLVAVSTYAPMRGMRYDESPIPETFLQEGELISIGEHSLTIILAPGHSPAHICFYAASEGFLIGGDVLFRNSIGRTDLPGGNHQQLLDNIKTKLYTLPAETKVYPGHGPYTTIAHEKQTNPYIRG